MEWCTLLQIGFFALHKALHFVETYDIIGWSLMGQNFSYRLI